MTRQPDSEQLLEQFSVLEKYSQRIDSLMDDLRVVLDRGTADFDSGEGVSPEDCAEAARLYQKIERKTVAFQRGTYKSHEDCTYFIDGNEGQKDWP